MIECGETGFRHYCPCTFVGVDLVTVEDASTLDGWRSYASHGVTSTCPRCGTSWALTSDLGRRRVPHPTSSPVAGEGEVRRTVWLVAPRAALHVAAA